LFGLGHLPDLALTWWYILESFFQVIKKLINRLWSYFCSFSHDVHLHLFLKGYMVTFQKRLSPINTWHDRMARGGHGVPKVLLGPTMPFPSTLCGWPPLKLPYSHFRSGYLQGGRPVVVFHPNGHPTPYASETWLVFGKSRYFHAPAV
jgi:hypothetical protein